tara:strand:+ start:464 stop:700 length:237 start_codon:yes stop_codon:yes gene_type:complete
MLRITGQDERVEDWLRPIPFPRHRVAHRGLTETPDTIELVEEAINRVQGDLDELNRLLSIDPLPFPRSQDDDDGPSAA